MPTVDLLNALQIKHPIIQAPMYGVTTPEMVAAACEANCLGSLPLGDLNYEQSSTLLNRCKEKTANIFAANIFVNDIPEITNDLRQKYLIVQDRLTQLAKELHYDVQFPTIEEAKPASYQDRIKAVLDQEIRLVSLTFGNIDANSIALLKNKHITIIGTCTSEEEAIKYINCGIDILCVQGIEAGGHRGSFKDDIIPQIGGLSLLHNVRRLTNLPIIYAGGISDKQSKDAAIGLGADGVQIGTSLICSLESALSKIEKERLLQAKEEDICLIKSFSGRYARGLKNKFTTIFEHSDYILPYPYQNKLTGAFRQAAKKNNNPDWQNLWCGQSYKNLKTTSTKEILECFI